MWDASRCFRCGKPLGMGKAIRVLGGRAGEGLKRVRVHERCNTSLGAQKVYFFGPRHEARRVIGVATAEAMAEVERRGLKVGGLRNE